MPTFLQPREDPNSQPVFSSPRLIWFLKLFLKNLKTGTGSHCVAQFTVVPGRLMTWHLQITTTANSDVYIPSPVSRVSLTQVS